MGATSTLAQRGRPAEMTITTSSKEALASYIKARDLLENVELASAKPLLDAAIASDPGFALAYVGLATSGGGSVQFQKNADVAVGLVDKVSPGERHLILALKAQLDNDPAARRKHAEALVKMFPKDKHAHFFAGQVALTGSNDADRALKHFTQAVALDRGFAAAYNMMGYAHIQLEDRTAAEADFKAYIALRPNNPNPYDSYGELLQRMGRFDESTAQYQMALAKDPSFASSMVRIGDNSLYKGDAAAAREWYRKSLEGSPSDGDRVNALGALRDSYAYEGKTTEALAANEELRTFAQTGAMMPALFNAHMSAALIQLEAGNTAEAKRHITAAQQTGDGETRSPGVKDGERMNAALGLARILSREQDTAGAAAQVEIARTIANSRGISVEQRKLEETRAFLALDRKQYGSALGHFAKGAPDDGYLMYYTAVAHDMKGDRRSASKLYSQAAAWNQPGLGYALVRMKAVTKAAEPMARK
jgi:tetratricopeptide (TPR) repeat protein